MRKLTFLSVAAGAAALAAPAQAQTVYAASGQNAVAIQGQVDAFRMALGALNGNNPGSVGSGRREINWDGVPDVFSSPNPFPGDFFDGNVAGRARGAVFTTPGGGFQVSATAGVAPIEFGDINPSYPSQFDIFSPQKLFTAVGSNVLDVNFFVPGSTTAALVRGFGSVFTDVDLANTTSLQFYDANNVLLGTNFAPSFQGDGSLSFLGVDYGSAVISRVRITSGNAALGPNDGGGIDVVAMDDFIYGEPIAAAVPEPRTWAMLVAGFGLLGWRLRGRRLPAAVLT